MGLIQHSVMSLKAGACLQELSIILKLKPGSWTLGRKQTESICLASHLRGAAGQLQFSRAWAACTILHLPQLDIPLPGPGMDLTCGVIGCAALSPFLCDASHTLITTDGQVEGQAGKADVYLFSMKAPKTTTKMDHFPHPIYTDNLCASHVFCLSS